MKLTICTPTYNRADTLPRVFESLMNQTLYDFEWIIVNDGSVDDTSAVVETFMQQDKFPVVFIEQENYGKHVALNQGVKQAKGTLFLILDSDDWLANDCVEKICKIEENLVDSSGYAGIAGVRVQSNGELIGNTFKGKKYIDCTSLERGRYNIDGDKAEVFYTKILRKFPFPAFQGEKFLTESVVWYRIASAGYKIRWTNEPLYFCEYLPGGLTRTSGKGIQNFEGYKLAAKEELSYQEISILRKMKLIATCGGIAIIKKQKLAKVAKEINCPVCIIFALGLLAFVYQKMTCRK